MEVVITSPSLDTSENVSGISSLAGLIIRHNQRYEYVHFVLGKRDGERRSAAWLARVLTAYGRWISVVLRHRERLIHFNLALDRLALLRDVPLVLAARLLRRRMILHLHGGKLFSRLHSSSRLRWVLKGIAGGHPTIVLGDREAKEVAACLDASNIVVLPNCVDLTDAASFERGYAAGDPIVVLFLGRIAEGKGLDRIRDAMKILTGRGVSLKFIMAGAGPEEARFVREFRDILGDAFEFKGVVSGSDKAALLKQCHVFLLPSLFEGLPMALLESMAFGLVPITTDVGSMGDVVRRGQAGIVLDSASPDAIAAALCSLMSNSLLAETMSRNARRFVFEHHGPDAYVERLNEVYQSE
jgi:glycosyltransferase involved in cell wall biosynthesis